ncbi:hypothetical protein LCGC14_0351470 [marine sediment metagenome]|uniref:Uncharacterized protein n=1 Tax=marine sediment metagenome TaxID=412755 RepID=A0A0F9WIP8_9ZZZZ
MNRRTFMRLIPALSAFPSIAEAVVSSTAESAHWTYEEFDRLMQQALRYSPVESFFYKGRYYVIKDTPDHVVKAILREIGRIK